jgi:TatD DNase family protein
LVETDAPYLAPPPHRGKVNEPAFLIHTLQALADLKDMPLERMASITNRNFFRLFGKVKAPASYVDLPAA